MQFFRNMQEPESTDITQYSGYTKLSGDQQKKVAETYTNVYNNNQGKLGFKVAQGIAYETAKKMCESYVEEAASPAASARAKAWKATEKARKSQSIEHHLSAQKAHVEAAKLHDGAKAKEHRGQAGVHGSIAASYRKHEDGNPKFQREGQDPAPGLVADEAGDGVVDSKISKPGPTYEGEKKCITCHKPSESVVCKDCEKTSKKRPVDRGQYGKQGMYDTFKEDEIQEGDAEDFQERNDALVGMTEKRDPISGMPTYGLEKTKMMKDIIGSPVPKPKKVANPKGTGVMPGHGPTKNLWPKVNEMEDGIVSAANPEEDGAAKILRMNHDTMCSGCGAVHPVDVMCFNGRTHSEAGAGGGTGSADILKQNHAQKGMKVEDSDPEIAAAARYLTNRAKVSGLMESLDEGSGDIQKKNVGQKCPDCGAMHDPKDECNNQSEPDTDKETKKEVDDANEILKKNHKDKGLEEKHIGFKALQGKLERSGKSAESAGAIAASIGKKKYGAAAMHKAAASHTPLGEDVELSEEIEQMWAENFYPAKPLEESCGNCSHPKSYHSKGCQTCNECERFTTEAVEESEHKKTQICYCGHEYGHHGNGGCKTCKHEGVVTPTKAAHQFRKNDYKERFEDEYNQIFAAQQGKINTSLANASLNWLPEELELQEGKGYDDIGPGDHVKFNHPLRGSDKVPQQGKGKVVMKGPAGWVVNMGGKHGTPGIVSKDNYVSHRKAVKKMTENQMIDSMTEDESPKPAVDPKKQAARKRANENRKERESVMRDMGLKKAKGALGGTYWESEELPEAETVKEETDPLMSAALGYINHEVSRAGGPSDLEEWKKGRSQFADPGGNSALRASSKSNPRNLPCPTCKEPNKLTPADKAKGYQCDGCANMEERGW